MAVAVLGMTLVTGDPVAQVLPASPAKPISFPVGHGAYNFDYREGVVCGAGASHDAGFSNPTVQCGAILSFGLFEYEMGVMGPQASHSDVSGYLSTNLIVPLTSLKSRDKAHGVPLVFGGYTRLFETGSGLDYGVAYAHPIDSPHSIRFDVRDDWVFSNPHQHNVMFRVVWLVGLPD